MTACTRKEESVKEVMVVCDGKIARYDKYVTYEYTYTVLYVLKRARVFRFFTRAAALLATAYLAQVSI